jgi:hypothetical protein
VRGVSEATIVNPLDVELFPKVSVNCFLQPSIKK